MRIGWRLGLSDQVKWPRAMNGAAGVDFEVSTVMVLPRVIFFVSSLTARGMIASVLSVIAVGCPNPREAKHVVAPCGTHPSLDMV